jgi:hypothetical protein
MEDKWFIIMKNPGSLFIAVGLDVVFTVYGLTYMTWRYRS